MATANVIDELIVKLALDSSDYEKNEKQINITINQTEKNLIKFDKRGQQNAKNEKKRSEEQNKRWKESTKAAKEFGSSLGKLALTIGSVLGVGGGAAGLVGAVVALTGFETNLRRATVSTGLSNREMQAWGSTARRLGADADSGAASLAALAKEQQQFNLTGNGPTIQAFARLGINAGPGQNIGDILAQAQQVYRNAAPGQRGQIEAGLSASGVSNDLIVMIKSEKDAREEFNRSLAESTTENRKALDAVSDSLAAVQNAALNLANSIASVAQPYIEQFAQFASDGAVKLSEFADKVAAAGGGVSGFTAVLKDENPKLAEALDTTIEVFKKVGEAAELAWYGLKLIGDGAKAAFDWIDKKLGGLLGGEKGEGSHPLRAAAGVVGDAIKWAWNESLRDARGGGTAKLTPGAQAQLDAMNGKPGAGGTPTGVKGRMSTDDFRSKLISAGYSAQQAAAIAANAEAESGGKGFVNGAAFNPAGGGTGARGLFQWRGARSAAFKARYGKMPNEATIDEQVEFLTTDPYERKLANSALARGNAMEMGRAFSQRFEGHGNVAQDIARAARAAQLAGMPGGAGTTVNLNGPVSIQADSPVQLVNGVQRVSGVQNFNSSTR